MATQLWIGGATAVAQVAQATFGTYDATTTRKITIGGTSGAPAVTISAVDSGGTLTAALTALTALLNASTHPYFSAITWTSDATHIIGTAKTAGVPFTFAGAVSGGTGTYGGYSVTTASAGPNDWSTAGNWSSGSVPVNGDDVYIQDNANNIAFGLAQSAITLNSLTIRKTWTGYLGLNRLAFTTDVAGNTASSTAAPEYRTLYLQIQLQGSKLINIEESASSQGTANGSKRIMIDLTAGTPTVGAVINILSSATTSADGNRPSIRFLLNDNTTDVFIRSAPGGFGIAMDASGESSVVRNVFVSDTTTASRVFIGAGVTMTKFEQTGGINLVQAGATLGTLNIKGGSCQTEGTFAVTTCNVYTGGTLYPNSTGTITTMNLYGGTVDFTQSSKARTVTTMAWQSGSSAVLKADLSILTITTPTLPSTKFTLTAS